MRHLSAKHEYCVRIFGNLQKFPWKIDGKWHMWSCNNIFVSVFVRCLLLLYTRILIIFWIQLILQNWNFTFLLTLTQNLIVTLVEILTLTSKFKPPVASNDNFLVKWKENELNRIRNRIKWQNFKWINYKNDTNI